MGELKLKEHWLLGGELENNAKEKGASYISKKQGP